MIFFSNDIKISYNGPVDSRVFSLIGDYIDSIRTINEKASKKLFKIFLELAQNTEYYSAKKVLLKNNKESGSGTLMIKETNEYFLLVTGNPIKNENIIPIVEKCKFINSLDRNSLRKYRREQRRRPPGKKGNAHIGLIQVALTSTHPLDVDVNPLDENTSFFSITVKIDK